MGIAHKKFLSTDYAIVTKNGEVVKEGLGISLFYNTLTTNLTVVPATAFDASFTFDDIITSDFQRVNVQGDISFIISNCRKAADFIDFAYTNDPEYRNKVTAAKNTISKRLINIIKANIVKYVSRTDIRNAITAHDAVTEMLRTVLAENTNVSGFGISVISVSVLGISPQPETRKALEAATREEILQSQDDATYKRRNASIEQERIVKENELNTEISVAEKEREMQEKAIAAQMSIQEKTAAANMQKLTDDAKFNEEKLAADGRLATAKRKQQTEEAIAAQADRMSVNRAAMEQEIDEWTYRAEEKDNVMHEANMRRAEYSKLEAAVLDEQKMHNADATAYANKVILQALESVDKEVLLALLLSGMDSKTLIAKAFGDLAGNADKIGSLNISPDLLESLTSSVKKSKVK